MRKPIFAELKAQLDKSQKSEGTGSDTRFGWDVLIQICRTITGLPASTRAWQPFFFFTKSPALSQEAAITTHNALGPTRHASSCDPSHRPIQVPSHPIHRPIRGKRSSHRPPSQRPNQVHQGRSARVPNGHASSVAPIARPSNYQSWQ